MYSQERIFSNHLYSSGHNLCSQATNTGDRICCVCPQIWERSNMESRYGFGDLSCSGWVLTYFSEENSELVEIDSHSRGRQTIETEVTAVPYCGLYEQWKTPHFSQTAFGIYHRHCSVKRHIQLLEIFANFLAEIKSKTTCIISNREYACDFGFVINQSPKFLATLLLKSEENTYCCAILCEKHSGWQSPILTGTTGELIGDDSEMHCPVHTETMKSVRSYVGRKGVSESTL